MGIRDEPDEAEPAPADDRAADDERLYESLLVLRCQTGDEAAFAQLIERYHARLRVFLTQMLCDAHADADADDVLQDVWLDVFRGVGKLRDLNAFAAWLYRIARDRAYRLLRGRNARIATAARADAARTDGARADVGVSTPAMAPPSPGTTSEAEDVEAAELLHASLKQLPHEQREVVLLRFVEGMSYETIARAVGCELGTVRSRLHYAKRALRRDLEQKGLS